MAGTGSKLAGSVNFGKLARKSQADGKGMNTGLCVPVIWVGFCQAFEVLKVNGFYEKGVCAALIGLDDVAQLAAFSESNDQERGEIGLFAQPFQERQAAAFRI